MILHAISLLFCWLEDFGSGVLACMSRVLYETKWGSAAQELLNQSVYSAWDVEQWPAKSSNAAMRVNCTDGIQVFDKGTSRLSQKAAGGRQYGRSRSNHLLE